MKLKMTMTNIPKSFLYWGPQPTPLINQLEIGGKHWQWRSDFQTVAAIIQVGLQNVLEQEQNKMYVKAKIFLHSQLNNAYKSQKHLI